MRAFEHLTKEQLAGYANRSLPPGETNVIEKHLLQCAGCRGLLPAPTPEQFWSALLTEETEREEIFKNEKPALAAASPVTFPFFGSTAAWSAGAFILIAVFSFLIWFTTSKKLNSAADVTHSRNDNSTGTIKIGKPPGNENSTNASSAGFDPMPPKNTSNPPQNIADGNPKIANKGQISRQFDVAAKRITKITEAERENKIEKLHPKSDKRVTSNTVGNRTIFEPARLIAKDVYKLRFPADLNRVIRAELLTLKGAYDEIDFDLISPVGTFVKDDSPTFLWQKAPEAIRYEIAVRSVKDAKTIFSETTSNTAYKVPKGIFDEYGEKVLQWSVTAYASDGSSRSTPSGNKPEALFMVIDRKKIAEVEKKLSEAKDDPLRRAVILAGAGLLDDAEKQIEIYSASHPSSRKAEMLLKQIRARRNLKGRVNLPNR